MSTGLGRQVELIRQQAAACEQLGSPFYAVLLERLAQEVSEGGSGTGGSAGAAVLDGHELDRGPSALALRLMAAVHRLVLTGGAPDLAAHYPSVGGTGDPDAAWPAFRQVLVEHVEQVRAGLASPPQTNEVGRSAALFGGLLQLVPDGLPIRLFEIGASAGMNLLADHFTYHAADGDAWPAEMASPAGGGESGVAGDDHGVLLDPAWDRVPEGAAPRVRIVERGGCDLSPIDATTEDGALSLLSCVWPDQSARLARLRSALVLAREEPVSLVAAGAGDYVESLELREGTRTVLWHSVMWQYLPQEEQHRVSEHVQALGQTATETMPFTHLAFEPRRLEADGPHRFVVTATSWPSGQERVLGEAPPHGVPVTWWGSGA
ncbi:DUF2332 domain-containing protein [Ornithinimicrobium cryptoxanthini]|uniref:DUF2332 domain-containing protein n=1 Tax=Ornithinimicrobium cryptoxanthini TaxID=2934161 RepID=A0ABY4YG86_9MICO|nr:DUF2332 domain-containing protein [Ornithinimicrobium cryptoxanthini]USQ75791.1 DUF2332 domain-containing protein [Ornithinimicrobium cryptoxanthini]